MPPPLVTVLDPCRGDQSRRALAKSDPSIWIAEPSVHWSAGTRAVSTSKGRDSRLFTSC